MKVKTENYYNSDRKKEYLSSLSTALQKSNVTLFNSISVWEYRYDTDLSELSEEILIDYAVRKKLYTKADVNNLNYLIKNYCTWQNTTPIKLNADSIQQEIINRKILYYPSSDISLFKSLMSAIAAKERETGLKFTTLYMDCVTYIMLNFYGVEDITLIKRTPFLDKTPESYIINGIRIHDSVHKYFCDYAKLTYISSPRKNYGQIVSNDSQLYSSDMLLRNTINSKGQEIKPIANLKSKISRDLQPYTETELTPNSISTAGIFSRAFDKELSNHIFTPKLISDIEYYSDLLSNNLGVRDDSLAEKYTVYKQVRFNNNI